MSEVLKNVPTDEVVAALYNDLRSRVEAVEPNDAMVAPDYADLTLPILVGTRCTHNRGLYKCNTQINSSEAWDSTHWDEITVGSELDNLQSNVSGKTDQGAVATPYGSLTWPVTAGQYCFQNGYVYRAKQDIATSESWTAAHWDQVVLGDEVCRAMNAIQGVENITKTINKTDYSSLFELGSLYTYNGQETSSTTRMRTEYIPDGVTAIIPDAGYKYMLFSYRKNDEEYIGTWTGSGWNRNGTWLTNGINIPNSISDEYYYRILGATVNNDELNLGTDAKHINIIWETDLLLNKRGKSADAKEAGDLIRTITDNNKKNVTDYVFDVAIKDKYQFSAADFESGSFDTSYMNKITNNKRLRTKYLIPVKSGMSFIYNNPLLDLKIFVFVSKDGSIAQETEWISSGGSGTITISSSGYLLVLLNSQNNISISDYSGTYVLEVEKTDYSNPLFFYKTPSQEPIPNGSSALSYNDFMTTTWESFRTAFSNNVTRNVLTNDTSDTFPIYEYIVTPSEHYTHTVLVAAGMHGDEYEGFWSLYRIINFLYTMGYKYEKTRDMLRNIKFIILPVLNPYGVEHKTRENSAGANAQDNYDVRWSDQSYRRTGTTPFQYNESKAVKLALEAHNDIEMFIEFHTDPYNPEKGNYTEVIETSALVPMAYNITLDERQNLKNDYGYTLPLSRDFVIWPTQQCNSIRYVEEVWNIPAILMETGIGGAAIGGTATLAEMAFNWYINCMIQAIKTLN